MNKQQAVVKGDVHKMARRAQDGSAGENRLPLDGWVDDLLSKIERDEELQREHDDYKRTKWGLTLP